MMQESNRFMINFLGKFLIVVVIAFTIFTSVSSVILYMQVRHDATDAANQAIHAAQTAQQGRSKSLCSALYELASESGGSNLQPAFINVYTASGCEQVIGGLQAPGQSH